MRLRKIFPLVTGASTSAVHMLDSSATDGIAKCLDQSIGTTTVVRHLTVARGGVLQREGPQNTPDFLSLLAAPDVGAVHILIDGFEGRCCSSVVLGITAFTAPVVLPINTDQRCVLRTLLGSSPLLGSIPIKIPNRSGDVQPPSRPSDQRIGITGWLYSTRFCKGYIAHVNMKATSLDLLGAPSKVVANTAWADHMVYMAWAD